MTSSFFYGIILIGDLDMWQLKIHISNNIVNLSKAGKKVLKDFESNTSVQKIDDDLYIYNSYSSKNIGSQILLSSDTKKLKDYFEKQKEQIVNKIDSLLENYNSLNESKALSGKADYFGFELSKSLLEEKKRIDDLKINYY